MRQIDSDGRSDAHRAYRSPQRRGPVLPPTMTRDRPGGQRRSRS